MNLLLPKEGREEELRYISQQMDRLLLSGHQGERPRGTRQKYVRNRRGISDTEQLSLSSHLEDEKSIEYRTMKSSFSFCRFSLSFPQLRDEEMRSRRGTIGGSSFSIC